MASPKTRDYFITINLGSPCYENALEITQELNTKVYALIKHDKDVLLDIDGTEIPKKEHKHIVLELKNPITFQSMQNHFPGAHIETVKYKKAAYQYLIHNRPNAKEKYQYAIEEIISNNLPAVKEAITAEEGIRLFRENEFMRYIAEGITNPYIFTITFGLNAYKQYWKPYQDMLLELQSNKDMQRDLANILRNMEQELPF